MPPDVLYLLGNHERLAVVPCEHPVRFGISHATQLTTPVSFGLAIAWLAIWAHAAAVDDKKNAVDS